jgi:hypothetical protein
MASKINMIMTEVMNERNGEMDIRGEAGCILFLA